MPVPLLLLILLYVLIGIVSLVAPLALLLSRSRIVEWPQLAACVPFFLLAIFLYTRSAGIRIILLIFAGALVALALGLGVLVAIVVLPPEPLPLFGWWVPRRLLLIGLGALLLAVALAHFAVLLRRDVADYLSGEGKSNSQKR